MKLTKEIKGVSLPLVVGLVSLLMISSVAANELIIRTLRSTQRIEAADRAYFAAEAGVEDALYELSSHFAGYETLAIPAGTPQAADTSRKGDMGGTVQWVNRWEIKSHGILSNIITGKFYEGQRLTISLYNDTGINNSVNTNGISSASASVTRPSLSNASFTFAIPSSTNINNSPLLIDNDNDGNVNEDGQDDDRPTGQPCSQAGKNYGPKDLDCDGREDEDSPEDPVILWRLTDGTGRSLVPVRGCLNETDPAPLPVGTELCEKSFSSSPSQISIDTNTLGIDSDDGLPHTIDYFIIATDPVAKLQIEFTIVAPMENTVGNQKTPLPYFEYTINYPNGTYLPTPSFVLKSDGWYQDFKQSITTTITPKSIAPLFDFTIIQQQ